MKKGLKRQTQPRRFLQSKEKRKDAEELDAVSRNHKKIKKKQNSR